MDIYAFSVLLFPKDDNPLARRVSFRNKNKIPEGD